jgi:transcriptional regulator with XRE-family HTH domain
VTFSQNFPELITRIRQITGWTQSDIAQRALVDRSYISQIESGKKEPSRRLGEKIMILAMQAGVELSQEDVTEYTGLVQEYRPLYDQTRPKKIIPDTIGRDEIEEHLRNYLDVAEQVPGGLGYAWGMARKYLDPDDLRKMKK